VSSLPPAVASIKPPDMSRSLLSGGTYVVANVAQRALAFVLLPIYATVLSPSEYGRLGLLIAIQAGATVALSAGMEAGVLRQYFRCAGDSPAQVRLVASAWRLLLGGAVLLSAVATILLVAFVPDGATLRPSEAALAIWAAATFVGATVVPLTVLRAAQRLRDYVVLTAVAGGATTLLSVLFVVLLRLGVAGWLLASLLSNALVLTAAVVVIPWARLERFDRAGVRAALAIGIPLIPHSASLWSLQLADRIVLAGLVVPSALGVYTLAANLSLPALVIMQSLNQGFLPDYARARPEDGNAPGLRGVITLQVLLVVAVGCSLALLGPCLATVLGSSYRGAGSLIGWMVLGYVFLGFYFIPMNVVSLVVGRTTFVWVMTVAAAAINIAGIVLFVPAYGILAAAIAAAVGYLVLFVLTALYARSHVITFGVDWIAVGRLSVVAAATYAAGNLATSDELLGVAVRTALLATLPVTLCLAARMPLLPTIRRMRAWAPLSRSV
jgi:O-antigen/teichoic acid export membrane protein